MRWREVLETAATIVVAVVWFVALRPVALGGPASYIVVHGYSMSGTLAPGDLVITEAQGNYWAGDAIVYRVPSGAGKGLLVVHRIIRADSAGYTMQGDANSFQDPWRPNHSNVVGRLVVTVPGLGRFLSTLANPFLLAAVWGLAALLVGTTFLPHPPAPTAGAQPQRGPARRRRRGLPDAVAALTPAVVGLMVGLVTLSFVVILNPAWDLVTAVLSVGGAVAVATVGLYIFREAPRQGLRARKMPTVPNPPRSGHSALRVAVACVLSILVGLVMVSACAALSPAHAARLTLHSAPVSAQIHLSSQAVAAAPSAKPSTHGTTPSASPARLNPTP